MVWTASGGILVGFLKLFDGDEFVACLCENISIHSVELQGFVRSILLLVCCAGRAPDEQT